MHGQEFAQIQAQTLKDLVPEYNAVEKKILDFGCGNGLMTYYVQDLFWHAQVSGVDSDAKMIANARKEYPGISFYTLDELAPQTSFDLIYAANVFHHIPRAHHKAILQKLFSHLKHQGILVIFELNPFNLNTLYTFTWNNVEKNGKLIMPSYWKSLLQDYNYIIRYHGFSWPLYYGEKFFSKLPFGAFYSAVIKK